jgi:hypothetical protein
MNSPDRSIAYLLTRLTGPLEWVCKNFETPLGLHVFWQSEPVGK